MLIASIRRHRQRSERIRELLDDLNDLRLKAKSSPFEDLGTQRRVYQRLIVDQLSALRLEQAEDRLLNNLFIAFISALVGILTAIAGMKFLNFWA